MDAKTKKILIITGASLLVLSLTLGLVFGLKKDKDDKNGDNGENEDTPPAPTPTEEVPVVTNPSGDTMSAEDWGKGTFPLSFGDHGSNVARMQVALNQIFTANNEKCSKKTESLSSDCYDSGYNVADKYHKLKIDGKFGLHTAHLINCIHPEFDCLTTPLGGLAWWCSVKNNCKLTKGEWSSIVNNPKVKYTASDEASIKSAERDWSSADGIGGYFSANGDYKEHRFAFGGNSETRENLAGWKDSDHQSEFWMSK